MAWWLSNCFTYWTAPFHSKDKPLTLGANKCWEGYRSVIEMGTGWGRKYFILSALFCIEETRDPLKVTQISEHFLTFHSCSITTYSKFKIPSLNKLLSTNNHHIHTVSHNVLYMPFPIHSLFPSPSTSFSPFSSIHTHAV